MTAVDQVVSGAQEAPGAETRPSASAAALLRATGWELEKLSALLRVRLALAVCVLGPLLFALGVELTQSLPADTLFGRWLDDSGFALPLVVLGFAASWGFPLLVGLVAADVFAAEDQLGTWGTILTRSQGRGTVFAAKVLATAAYVVAALVLLTAAGLAAGLLVEGSHPLIGLSGNVLPPASAMRAVLLASASVVPPCLALAAVGILLSVLTRHGLGALVGTVVLGLAMQLATLVDGIQPVRRLLVGTQLLAWHGLFTDPRSTAPLGRDAWVSLVWVVVCLVPAWWVLRRRDVR